MIVNASNGTTYYSRKKVEQNILFPKDLDPCNPTCLLGIA